MASVAAYAGGNVINAGPLFDPAAQSVELRAHLDRYEQSIDLTQASRNASLASVRYYENDQWTAAERTELKERKQPIVTENHIQPKVDFLVGLEITTRTDPKAFPRTPNDEESAEGATDSVRYVVDNNNFPATASENWKDMLVPGYTAVELGVEQGADGQAEIRIQGWKWDRLFADPYSRKLDYTDANFLGGVKWMDLAEAMREFPGKESEAKLRMAFAYGDLSNTHEDRPHFATSYYADSKRNRVMIVYMWYRRGGQWWWVKFTRGGILQQAPCPYVDEDGKHWCPLIMQAAYKDIENNAYGLVEYMKSTQDEINHRRSRAMYHLSRRGVIRSKGATNLSGDQLRKEIAKPDYDIELTHPEARFDIDRGEDLSQGQMVLLSESQTHMDRLGPNASMVGKDEREQSGRALLAQSQSGFVELQPLLDRHRNFKRRVYQGIWWLIKQFWTQERWIRITDDEGKARFVGLNQPVPVAEYVVHAMQERGADEQEILQRLAAMQMSGEIYGVIRKNDVGRMKMDFVIEEVPDHATVQTEAFQQLMEFMPNLVQLLQINPRLAKAVLEASPLRNKKMLIEALDGQPEDPQAQQQAAIQQELQMRGAIAEIASREGEAATKQAQAAKTMAEAEILPSTAESNAIKARAAMIQAVSPPF